MNDKTVAEEYEKVLSTLIQGVRSIAWDHPEMGSDEILKTLADTRADIMKRKKELEDELAKLDDELLPADPEKAPDDNAWFTICHKDRELKRLLKDLA